MVRRLLLLNGIAAIFAVAHHSVHWALTSMFWWTNQYRPAPIPDFSAIGGAQYYMVRLVDQLAVSAVPAFLFVSGFFVASSVGSRPTLGWENIASRIRALVPAYLVWSLVAVALNVAGGDGYSPRRLAWVLLTGGAAAPFYYVPLLIQLYVLAHWAAPLARRYSVATLIVTGLVQAGVALVRGCSVAQLELCAPRHELLGPVLNSQIASYSFWFALGLVASFHQERFKAVLQRLRPTLPWLLPAVAVLAFVEWDLVRRASGRDWVPSGVGLGDNLFELVLLMAFFAYDSVRLPLQGGLEEVGAMSYGIYLTHMPVLEVTARGIYHALPMLLAYQIPLMLLTTAVGVGLPVGLMRAAKASPARRFYRYAFG